MAIAIYSTRRLRERSISMKAMRPQIRVCLSTVVLSWICGCALRSDSGETTIGITSSPNAPSYAVTDFFDRNRPKEGSTVCVIGVVDSFEDCGTFWLRPYPPSIASPCLQVKYAGSKPKHDAYWNPIGHECVVHGIVAYDEVRDFSYFLKLREDYRQGISTHGNAGNATRVLYIRADQIRARDRRPVPTGEFENR